ncbi:sulfite exporter TauE/SafE family protein [Lutibacter sp.]|uniref:sulfite exporter TauE/SafE family protein n=1 Tax=Lutibacter sp. TaxID=1925666 RepID=UPI00356977C2
MEFLSFVSDYGFLSLLSLAIFSFIAGFIDSVVGGGGLIQLPALLINLPNTNIPTLFGTNKIAALAGTSISAVQYSKKIKFNFKVLFVIAFWAAVASYFGAKTVSYINVNTLKPLILVILIAIAIYTFIKKNLGNIQTKKLSLNKMVIYGSIIGLIIGFYDGFFGPGTGSFLVLAFVVVFGFEFVEASAYSKVINCVTNIFALLVFIKNGDFIIELAILMAICNITGNIIGTRLALKRGNQFVRTIFLVIVTLMIARYAYDIFFK